MPVSLLPDPETLMVAALKAQPSVTAIVAARIGTRIPDVPTFPLIRVTHIAGGPDTLASEFVVIQIECWADDDATASLLARTIVACHTDMRNVSAAGWLALTDPVSLIPMPDPVSERFRYIIDLDVEMGY